MELNISDKILFVWWWFGGSRTVSGHWGGCWFFGWLWILICMVRVYNIPGVSKYFSSSPRWSWESLERILLFESILRLLILYLNREAVACSTTSLGLNIGSVLLTKNWEATIHNPMELFIFVLLYSLSMNASCYVWCLLQCMNCEARWGYL